MYKEFQIGLPCVSVNLGKDLKQSVLQIRHTIHFKNEHNWVLYTSKTNVNLANLKNVLCTWHAIFCDNRVFCFFKKRVKYTDTCMHLIISTLLAGSLLNPLYTNECIHLV